MDTQTRETRRLSVRIDRDLKHALHREADDRGQSLTVFVERALRQALPENRRPKQHARPADYSYNSQPQPAKREEHTHAQ